MISVRVDIISIIKVYIYLLVKISLEVLYLLSQYLT